MLSTQGRKNIGGIQTGIFAQLSGDDFQCLGVGSYNQLLLSFDFQGPFSEGIRDAHFYGTTTGNDGSRHDGSFDYHQSIVHTALALGNELLGSSSQNNRARQGRRALREQIESLVTNPSLFEHSTRSQNRFGQAIGGGLNGSVGGLCDSLHVAIGHSAGTEQTAIGKVLGRQVSNRQFRQDNVGTALDARIELVVNDLPFGLDDRLVILGARNADLGVFLLRFEFQFDIQQKDFGVLEFFGHLFESGVRKGLFEGNSLH
mmetsp:Transcript_13/g.31  ORF Transcript_13/g.31 Transcript_13/m.31 type:complete len:259 (-) Transcript_13:750-1526(-)